MKVALGSADNDLCHPSEAALCFCGLLAGRVALESLRGFLFLLISRLLGLLQTAVKSTCLTRCSTLRAAEVLRCDFACCDPQLTCHTSNRWFVEMFMCIFGKPSFHLLL